MISFVVPTYNEASTIEATLRQLHELRDIPFEVIVSDNKSEDATLLLAANLAHQLVKNDDAQRTTIGHTRNRGAALAKHPYLLFIDSAVTIPEVNDFVRQALSVFEKNPNTVAMTVNVRVNRDTATWADNLFFGMLDAWFWFNNNVLGNGMGNGKFLMIRADAFNVVGGFQSALAAAEDVEIFKRLSKIGTTFFNRSLTVYHPGRRAHAYGWPKLLFLWIINGLSVMFFKRAVSKEWKSVR